MKYLERVLYWSDNDWPAVHRNVEKVTLIMESDEETAKEGGGGTVSVHHVLLGGGPVDTPYVTRVTIGFSYLQ